MQEGGRLGEMVADERFQIHSGSTETKKFGIMVKRVACIKEVSNIVIRLKGRSSVSRTRGRLREVVAYERSRI